MHKEALKKILLCGISFIVYALNIMTYIHAISLFLNKLGPENLPISLVIIASLVVLNSIVGAALSSKITSDKIFIGMLIFFFVNYFVMTLLPAGDFKIFYFLIIADFATYMQEIVIINFSNSLLTPLQSKSYLPLIYSFMSAGIIAGSLGAEWYIPVHEAIGIGWLPMIGIALTLIFIGFGSKIFRKEVKESFSPGEGLIKNTKDSIRFLFHRGKLYLYIAGAIFLFEGLMLLIDFKMKTVLSYTFDSAKLAEVLSLIYLSRSLLSWVLSALVAKKMLFRFGVSNMLVFFPVSILATIIIAIITKMNYLAVILMFCTYSVSYFVYFGICASQILSLVPKEKQSSIYFLLRGLIYALGILFFSSITLIYSYNINLEPILNTSLIIAVCAILLGVLLKVKKLYFEELKENLYKDDEFLKQRSIDLLAEKTSKDDGEIHLRRILNLPSVTKDTRSKVLVSLGIIGNHQTIVDLAQILMTKKESPRLKAEAVQAISMIIKKGKELDKYPVSKHYLLEAYEQVLLNDSPLYLKMEVISSLRYFDLDDVIKFLEEHLNDKHVNIKTNAIKTLATFHDRGIIPYIKPFLDSKDWSVVGTTVAALWQFQEMRLLLIPKMGEMIGVNTVSAIINVLYLIGMINATWERDYVLRQLKNENSHVRIYALITLIQLGENERIKDLVTKMLWLAKRGNRNELEFILSRYRHFSDSTKKELIKMVQAMQADDARRFYEIFRESVYVFKWEEAELGG